MRIIIMMWRIACLIFFSNQRHAERYVVCSSQLFENVMPCLDTLVQAFVIKKKKTDLKSRYNGKSGSATRPYPICVVTSA